MKGGLPLFHGDFLMFDHQEPGIAAEPCDVIDFSSDAPRVKRSPAPSQSEETDVAFLLRRAQIADLRIRDLEETLAREQADRAADLADAEHRTTDLSTRLKIALEERDQMTAAYHTRMGASGKLDSTFRDRLLARTLWTVVPWTALLAVTVFLADIYFL